METTHFRCERTLNATIQSTKPLPIDVELSPDTWMVSILISISKFHSLFSSDADHISFLSFENRTKKYYDNQLFTSSIAVVLSQILQLKIHDSIRSLI